MQKAQAELAWAFLFVNGNERALILCLLTDINILLFLIRNYYK